MMGRRYYASNTTNVINKVYNFLIQGSGAYMLKQKVVEIYHFLKKTNTGMESILNIHDEIVLNIPKHNDVRSCLETVKKMLASFPNFKIPMVVSTEISRTNWEQKEKIVL